MGKRSRRPAPHRGSILHHSHTPLLPHRTRFVLLGLAASIALCFPAGAVIKRLYPLAAIIADADSIYPARVAALDRKAHRVTLTPGTALKGSAPAAPMKVALAGGDDRTQLPTLEERLPPGRLVLLFGKARRFTLGYTNGTWFRLAEPAAGKPWQFVHLELFLPRTFNGKTEALRQVTADVLAGKAKAPEPNPDIKPGFGPP